MKREELRQLRQLMEELKRDEHRLKGMDRKTAREAFAAMDQRRERVQSILEEIENIPDSLTREIVKLKYLDGLSWVAIGRTVHLSVPACKRRHGKETS